MFTKDINKAILISDAMESGTVQINSAPARGPDHFPFQVTRSKKKKKRICFSFPFAHWCIWFDSIDLIGSNYWIDPLFYLVNNEIELDNQIWIMYCIGLSCAIESYISIVYCVVQLK